MMHKGRLEALSDGVIAIIITIMVLEFKMPHSNDIRALLPMWPTFVSYVLSFLYVGIYWNNHHHTFQAARSVNGGILWANLHLLFWLSLLPFVTGWMGENNFTRWPVVMYGVIMLMCAVAYSVMIHSLISHHGKQSIIARAVGKDLKGNLSMVLYALAIALAFCCPWVSIVLYFVVASMWIVPDKRIERHIGSLNTD